MRDVKIYVSSKLKELEKEEIVGPLNEILDHYGIPIDLLKDCGVYSDYLISLGTHEHLAHEIAESINSMRRGYSAVVVWPFSDMPPTATTG